MRLIPLLLTTCLIAGCVPRQFFDRPGASGDVVDAASGAPVPDALVAIEGPVSQSFVRDAHTEGVTTTTSVDGHFAIDPQSRWIWTFFIGDFGAAHGILTIAKPGYVTEQRNLVNTNDLGRIQLRAAPAAQR